MKPCIKIMLIIASVCMPNRVIFAAQECKQTESSSSSQPTLNQTKLGKQKKIKGVFQKISPDMRYIFLHSSDGTANVYDLETHEMAIKHLSADNEINDNFSTIFSSSLINDDGLTPPHYSFRLYDFQTKKKDPSASHFFLQEGTDLMVSPDGHYALVTKSVRAHNGHPQTKYFVYDIQSHNRIIRHPLLFSLEAGNKVSFSADSKKIKIERPMSIEIIDIARKTQSTTSSIELQKNDYGSQPKLDPNFTYIIRPEHSNNQYSVSLYDVQALINNADTAPLAILPQSHHVTATFGPQAKMLALSNLKHQKTDFYDLEKLTPGNTPDPLFSMPNIHPKISPHNEFALTFNPFNGTCNSYQIATKKLTTGIDINLANMYSFSSDGKYILAKSYPAIVYDLQKNKLLMKAKGRPLLLNNEKGFFITEDENNMYINDIGSLKE